MPKVLQILYSGLGGQSSVFFSLVEADKTNSVSHEVIFFGNVPVVDSYKTRCHINGIEPYAIKKFRGPGLVARKRLFDRMVALKPDVIILHLPLVVNTVAEYCKKVPSTQLITVEHHANDLKTRRDWRFSQLLMRYADLVVFLTPLYMEEVRDKLGKNFTPSKAVLIPNGIDINHYNADANTNERPIKDRIRMLNQLSQLSGVGEQGSHQNVAIVLGMCSRLSDQKDIETLIESLQYFRTDDLKPKLFIAGDGPQRAVLEKLSVDLGVAHHVTFLGMLRESDIRQFLNLLDVYVHATLAETMSTAVMQALSMSLPVIASDVPGMSTLITHDKTGYLVRPRDPKQLSEVIASLSIDKMGAMTVGTRARAFAESRLSNVRCWSDYKRLFAK